MSCLNFSIISNVRSFFTKSKRAFTEKVNLEVVKSAIKAGKEKFKVESKKIFKKLWRPIGNLLKNINLKAPNVFAGKNETSQAAEVVSQNQPAKEKSERVNTANTTSNSPGTDGVSKNGDVDDSQANSSQEESPNHGEIARHGNNLNFDIKVVSATGDNDKNQIIQGAESQKQPVGEGIGGTQDNGESQINQAEPQNQPAVENIDYTQGRVSDDANKEGEKANTANTASNPPIADVVASKNRDVDNNQAILPLTQARVENQPARENENMDGTQDNMSDDANKEGEESNTISAVSNPPIANGVASENGDVDEDQTSLSQSKLENQPAREENENMDGTEGKVISQSIISSFQRKYRKVKGMVKTKIFSSSKS